MAEQRHSQSPPESQLWEGAVNPTTTPPPTQPHPPWVPRPAPLTRRHHTHTARSAAVGAPPRGTGQRVAAALPRSGRGPSRHGAHSPAGMPPWTSQTPVQHPTSGTTPHPGFRLLPPSTFPRSPTHPHGTGVQQVPWLRAERTEAPGVGSQFSGGLQDPLAAPEVVTGVSIEVSTQASHPAAELGGQLHQDPGTWTESVAGGLWRLIWGPSSGPGVGRRPAGGGALVTQPCPTLAALMDCSPPGSSVHGMLQPWSGLPCPSPEDLPDPGIKPRSPALQADSLLTELREWGEGLGAYIMWAGLTI